MCGDGSRVHFSLKLLFSLRWGTTSKLSVRGSFGIKNFLIHYDADPHHDDCVSLMYDGFRLRSTSSMVASFLLFPEKEGMKQGRKAAATVTPA